MNLNQVINSWMNSIPASIKNNNGTKTLHTDGFTLYSYTQAIGDTVGREKVVISYLDKDISKTTAKHIQLAAGSTPAVMSGELWHRQRRFK